MRKKIILGITSILTFFAFTLNVFAGNVTLSFLGNETVTVNNNIDVIVRASDITGLTQGMATAQGDISFDESYLEFISSEDVSSLLSVSYGTKTKRFVALGLSGEYIDNADNLLKLTFKAKQVGTTKLNISNVVIGDTKAIIHGSNVLEKTINIVEANNSTPAPSTPAPANKAPAKAPSKSSSKAPAKASSKSNDATLAKLLINNAKVTPNFSKDVNSYTVTVSKDVNKLTFDYTTTDKKATVKVIGNDNLKDKETNTIQIIVTAEDGTTNTYTLNVNKSDEVVDNKLKDLIVKESPLTFDEDNYEYNLTVGSKVDKLTIDAIPKSKDSKVEIIGNSKLAKGNNVILIKVTDKNGFVNYYKLNVKKDGTTKIFGIKLKYILYFILFLLILLLLFFLFLLIILLLKRKKKKEKEPVKKMVKEQVEEQNNEGLVVVKKEDLEKLRNHQPKFKSEEENVDIYDDVVTKDELIDAIEERNPKKLKMLLAQEEANKLKEELQKEEAEDNLDKYLD